MPPELLAVITHVHTDGPIPGPHSLLTLVSVAVPFSGPAGGPIERFRVNLGELPGATLHPRALRTWQRRPADWLATRQGSRPPALAMAAYLRWVERLPGAAAFTAGSASSDYLFLYWYLQRFTGRWPFGAVVEPREIRIDCRSLCPLSGCRTHD